MRLLAALGVSTPNSRNGDYVKFRTVASFQACNSRPTFRTVQGSADGVAGSGGVKWPVFGTEHRKNNNLGETSSVYNFCLCLCMCDRSL